MRPGDRRQARHGQPRPQHTAASAGLMLLLAPFLTILAESKNSDKTDNWRWPRLVWLLAAALTVDTLTHSSRN